jgi:hypothetical protein
MFMTLFMRCSVDRIILSARLIEKVVVSVVVVFVIFTGETAVPCGRINTSINSASRYRQSVTTGPGTLLYSSAAGDTRGDDKFNYLKVVTQSRPLDRQVVVRM